MQQELKQKWVTALRSGEYKQIKQHLKDDKGFCCLGVLLEVEGIVKPELDSSGLYYYESSCSSPTLATERRWGISPKDISILMEMNDIQKKSFIKIADWVEEKL